MKSFLQFSQVEAGADPLIPNDAGQYAVNVAARCGAKNALATIVRLAENKNPGGGKKVLAWPDAEGVLFFLVYFM